MLDRAHRSTKSRRVRQSWCRGIRKRPQQAAVDRLRSDLVAPIGSLRTRADCASGESPHAEYLRQRFLGERKDVVVGPIAKLEQPAGHPCLDRM